MRVITPPDFEPLDLDDVRVQVRADGNEEDALLAGFIAAARQAAEHRTGRAYGSQVREMSFDTWCDPLRLIGYPVTSIESVKYLDSDGVLQTLDPSSYTDPTDQPARIYLLDIGPTLQAVKGAIRITYECGADMPDCVKTWCLLTVGSLYRNRESVTSAAANELPRTLYDSMLDREVIY